MKILWQSPTLSTVAIYAAALGFVGANLVLARLLPTVEYGLLTLIVALANLGFLLPLWIVALGFLLAAAMGWHALFRGRSGQPADKVRFSWKSRHRPMTTPR